MKNALCTASIVALITLFGCNTQTKENMPTENPFFTEYTTPFQVPPFESIKAEHYMPAFKEGMKEQKSNVEKIISNTEKPTFENTIVALENSKTILNKVSSVFYNLSSAKTDSAMQAINKELAPIMAGHSDDINLNEKLFAKVKSVYENKSTLSLSTQQNTLLENTYRNFVRGGANLEGEKKEAFRKVNEELSLLYEKFKGKLLNENNSFKLFIENEADLKGLTETSIAAAAEAATNDGQEGKWLFTVSKPSLLPFLENAENRELREKLYKGYINQGDNNNENDTKEVLQQIANARIKRANLLGFDTHADYVLDKNMAKEPAKVYELLDKLMPSALKVAKKEVADMQAIVDAEKGGFKIEAWDYWYYAAKVKEQKYALNENQIRPYLKLENARDGMFWVANQLFGITFTKLDNMPIYHHEVEVFEAKEENGDHIGILYMEYHPRASKRSGAWCTSYRSQKYVDGKRVAPVVSIVCNFSAPVGDTPALLSVDETETLFHEFGHGLDALFSNKQYASLRVPRDFVELPSQIMENWAFAPEVLNQYAKHYKTGEAMPNELIEKIEKAGKFNQGFATTEYLAASYLDMDWHTAKEEITMDVNAFEKKSMDKVGLIAEIAPRYRSTYFQHIFAGASYSSGYYSYVWAEVLDADAFEAFKENGLFDKTTAAAFRTNILELGGTEDAMESYRKFRGTDPKIQPLIERRGLN